MHALTIHAPGPEATLTLDARPAVSLADGEARVTVRASGLNRADVLQLRGKYPAPAGATSDVPGLEFSGVVSESRCVWPVGARVMGLVSAAAHASEVNVHGDLLCQVPEHWPDAFAAAYPEIFATAYDAIIVQGHLKQDQRVLLHAVGSGVGAAALHIVKASGGYAIGTSRSQRKLDAARAFGLDQSIRVESDPNYGAALEDAGGVHLVLNPIGAGYVGEDLRALAIGGTMVVIGLLNGIKAEVSFADVLRKRAVIRGSTLRSRSIEEKKQLLQAIAEYGARHFSTEAEVTRWAANIATFPSGSALEAFLQMEKNALASAKAVLVWEQ